MRLAIEWLKEATPTAVVRRLGLSWDAARGIMEGAVRRGQQRRQPTVVSHLGIDEKSFLTRHQYVSVVVEGIGISIGVGRRSVEHTARSPTSPAPRDRRRRALRLARAPRAP